MMPGMDGLTATAKLSEDPVTEKIPILMFTAKVDDQSRAAYATAGAVGVIAKPFDPRGLGGALDAAVHPRN